MKVKICPICVVVSSTWLLMTAGILAGKLPLADYQLPLAILMGGSVVGIADKIGNRKILVVSAGLLLVYYAIKFMNWAVFGIEVVVLGVIAYVYFIMPEKIVKTASDPTKTQEIEEKLKNCC